MANFPGSQDGERQMVRVIELDPKGRGSWAAKVARWVVLIVTLAILAGGVVTYSAARRAKAEREAAAKMRAEVDQRAQRMHEEIREKGYAADHAGLVEQNAQSLERAAKAVGDTGSTRAKVMRASATVTRELGQIGGAYNERLKAWIDAGTVGPEGLDRPGAIEARLAMLEGLQTANAALLGAVREMEPRFVRALRAEGVPEGEMAGAVSGLMSGIPSATLIALRELDIEYAARAREYLGVLSRALGQWTVDEEGVEFSESVPEAERALFAKAAEELGRIGQRQDELMGELQRARAGVGAPPAPR
jgi:hypothetical protein